MDTRHTDTKPGAAVRLAYGAKVREYRDIQHALVGEPFVFGDGRRGRKVGMYRYGELNWQVGCRLVGWLVMMVVVNLLLHVLASYCY